MNDIDILKSVYKGNELDEAIEKYNSGIPAAYIIGEWEFCGDKYIINDSCLIPRCDTERVVEKVLDNLNDGQTLADICTGTGCIAISCLKRKKLSKGLAVDISSDAVEVAKKNAELNGVANRLEIICADAFKNPLENKTFDIIVSNPPYIPTKDLTSLDVYVKKEPIIALDGGQDGMLFYRHIITNYGKNLKENGKFIFEIGYDQEDLIKTLSKEHGYSCSVTKDYSGNPRVAFISKNKISEDL